MGQHTPTPWQFSNRNWRGEEDPHNWYVTGDHSEGWPPDPDDSESEDEGPSCVSVAVVVGNPTAGDIPRANAELIVRAVNAHADLLAALVRVANLAANCCPRSPSGDEAIEEARAAIRKARGES